MRNIILHITNDYSGSTVYMNLISELDNLGIPQIVYNPIRDPNRIGKNAIDFKTEGSKIIYSSILNYHIDRLLYSWKIKKILKDIESKVDFSKVNLIHAHTWYSDGGVAYLLSKKYNIPYIIAVRNTDLNVHYKYFVHHRRLGYKILESAKEIILIGEYQNKFFKNNFEDNIYSKIKVIPNGVNNFWIDNSKIFKPEKDINKFKILYVGTFIKRKKLLELQQAVIELSKINNSKLELHIVGEGGKQTKKILKFIQKYPKLFIYHGKVDQKEKLEKIYNNCHIFVMPSKYETFGLVYIEALLQGLPILYTKDEGIDGLYSEKIGDKVSIGNVEEIKKKILKMVNDYSSYDIPTEKLKENHNWTNLALIYNKIYNEK